MPAPIPTTYNLATLPADELERILCNHPDPTVRMLAERLSEVEPALQAFYDAEVDGPQDIEQLQDTIRELQTQHDSDRDRDRGRIEELENELEEAWRKIDALGGDPDD